MAKPTRKAKSTPKIKASPKPKTLDFQAFAQKFIDNVGIEGTVSLEKDGDLLQFQIETAEPGVLIGFHGETLSALQRVLGLAIEKQTGTWHKISVNVGDYRERREETLKNLALTTAQRVKFSGQPWPLPPLSAAERRIVHLALADNPDVTSESEGEGSNRRVIVKPKEK